MSKKKLSAEAIAGVGGVALGVLVAIVSSSYWGGKLEGRVSALENEKEQSKKALQEAIAAADEKVNAAVARARDLGEKMSHGQLYLSRGGNVLPIKVEQGGVLIALRLTGSEYEYSYWLAAAKGPPDKRGSHDVIATLSSMNGAGYGAPFMFIDEDARLNVNNDLYPHGKISAEYSVVRFGK